MQEIQPRLDELIRQWKELEETTAAKGEKLFDANRHILYEQSCDDIDGWINEIESQIITDDVGHDLTTVNLLVQKQNVCTSFIISSTSTDRTVSSFFYCFASVTGRASSLQKFCCSRNLLLQSVFLA